MPRLYEMEDNQKIFHWQCLSGALTKLYSEANIASTAHMHPEYVYICICVCMDECVYDVTLYSSVHSNYLL